MAYCMGTIGYSGDEKNIYFMLTGKENVVSE